jgi:hypothetical protein
MNQQPPPTPDTPLSTFPPLTGLSLRGRGGVRAVSGICRCVISLWIARRRAATSGLARRRLACGAPPAGERSVGEPPTLIG